MWGFLFVCLSFEIPGIDVSYINKRRAQLLQRNIGLKGITQLVAIP